MSVTGPQTREMQSCGVEMSSATGRLPSAWVSETLAIDSAGRRVVSSDRLPPTEASVSVATRGGGWPTSGIGERAAMAISPWAPVSPVGVRVSASTSSVPGRGSGTCAA